MNGEPASPAQPLAADDEVAVLPPVSGGAVDAAALPPAGRTPPLRRKRLAVVPTDDGPHVRLGVAWALATSVVVAVGVVPSGVWFAAVAALGALQASRGWRSRARQPFAPLAIGAAAAMPLAAVAGWWGVGVAVLAIAVVVTVIELTTPGPSAARNPLLTLLVAVPIGLAAASPVLVRRLGLVEPLVLLGMVWAYDAGSYLVGSGALTAWEGAAAGVVSIVPVTVAAAVALVPDVPTGPWILGGIAAALAPLGPPLATIVIGDDRASAVRRMDSLLLAGPVWAGVAGFVLR